MDKIKGILKFAMRMEKDAGDFYAFYLDRVRSAEMKDLFKSLAEMEHKHFEVIKKRYDELGFVDAPLSISWVVDNNFASKDPHILSNSSDMLQEEEMSDISVIRMAYLIESDFAEFYHSAVKNVDELHTRNLLRSLSDWEDDHKKLFQKRYYDLLKKHWGNALDFMLLD